MNRAIWAVIIAMLASVFMAIPASASSWAFCASDPEGTWQPGFNRWFVQNDAWNGSAGPQTICAHTVTLWTAWSTQRGTAVETYPDTQKVFGEIAGKGHSPYSSYSRITSNFNVTMPRGQISAEAAYDVWWGNGWDTKVELMIWVNSVNRSMDGSDYLGKTIIYGQTFRIYHYDGSPAEYVFRLDHNESKGTVHILSAARWLVNHHYMSRNTGLTAIPFGFEVCGTGGVRRAFTLNSLSMNVYGGTG